MAQPTNPDAETASEAGIIEHIRSLLASVAGYFQARLQLAGVESKEALSHYVKVLALVALALAGLLFGYTLFLSLIHI